MYDVYNNNVIRREYFCTIKELVIELFFLLNKENAIVDFMRAER